MTEAAVCFAGNLTDDPEVRYTEGGIARAMFPGYLMTRRIERATAGMPSCMAKQVTRQVRNREAPPPESQLT